MAVATAAPRTGESTSLAGLGRALVQHQMLRLDLATTIQRKADAGGIAFIDELIGGGHMQARQLAKFAAEVFGHPLLDLSAIDVTTLRARRARPQARHRGARRGAGQARRTTVAGGVGPDRPEAARRIRFSAQANGRDAIVVEHDKLTRLVESWGKPRPTS